MNILVTGSNGQLGSELIRCLATGHSELGPIPSAYSNTEVYGIDLPQYDIADLGSVREVADKYKPDIIFNCAAYTNVDGCESDPESAFRANAIGARNMALIAQDHYAKLIHVSTDYVFSGNSGRPYWEWDMCAPNSVYGYTKMMGETYVREFCNSYFIVRVAWLYGYQGSNFVKTILKAAREKGAVRIVNDQVGNPTNAADLAHHLLLLGETQEFGVYHCTGNGECSWYDFACEFIALSGIECAVSPCSTEEFPRPANRPSYSSLDNLMLRCTIGDGMRPWKDAIAAYMAHYNNETGGFNI